MRNESKTESDKSIATVNETNEFFATLSEYILRQCEGDESKATEVLRIIRALRLSNSKAN